MSDSISDLCCLCRRDLITYSFIVMSHLIFGGIFSKFVVLHGVFLVWWVSCLRLGKDIIWVGVVCFHGNLSLFLFYGLFRMKEIIEFS